MFFAFVSPSNFGGITLHILPLLVYPGYSQMLRRDKSGVSPYENTSSCRWLFLLAVQLYHILGE